MRYYYYAAWYGNGTNYKHQFYRKVRLSCDIVSAP